MPLISLVITLIVVGLLLWLFNTYIPCDPAIRKIINVVVIVATIFWLLSLFGLLNHLGTIRVGR